MMQLAMYFIFGFLTKAILDGLKSVSKEIKERKRIEQRFKQVLRRIRKGKSDFKTRVNDTVYITMQLHEIGEVDIVFFLDSKRVGIFKENKCLEVSDSINKELNDEIVAEIETRYKEDIDDVVELLGNKISKKEVDEKIENISQIVNSKLEDIFKSSGLSNDIEPVEEVHSEEDINAIFDKIAKSGIESITPAEKKILDDYSNNLK